MYIGYDTAPSAAGIQLASVVFTRPPDATFVELQAEPQNIRYRMDGVDPTATAGMLLIVGLPAKLFLIEDFDRLRWSQVVAGAGVLHCHYIAPREY